jgi:Patatin-like phospholipase
MCIRGPSKSLHSVTTGFFTYGIETGPDMDGSTTAPERAPDRNLPWEQPAPAGDGKGAPPVGAAAAPGAAGQGGTQPSPDAPPGPGEPPPGAGDWAVCCSGGGIRSATYSLGGLQALEEGGLLSRAKWIVGVSGGSYIAASRALVARGLAEDARRDPSRARRPAYARGTPEEQNLRNNTRYIAPDAKTVLMAILSLLLGAAVTCLLVLAPLYAFAHAWGWLLRGQGVLTWSNGQVTASVTALPWLLPTAIAAAVTLILFLYWWGTLVSGGPGRGEQRASAVGWAAAVTAGLALLMLAAPPVIAWLYHSTGALGTVVRFFGFGGSGPRSVAALTGVVAAIATIAGSLQKQLARLRLAAPAGAPGGTAPGGVVASVLAWARATLTPWLASLVIIAVGAFAILLWIGNAARAGFSSDQLVPVLVAVGVMLGTRAFADINRTSLHDFYRWRLADAYAVTRDAVQARSAAAREELFARAARIRLSELGDDARTREQRGGPPGPQLVIATTANINADRDVPPGRGGFCLAFASDKVTLRADPSYGEKNVTAETADYECLLGQTRFTLFDVVAISGAAFSPLMGAATRGAYRIVLTLTNLRLGVWLPHPAVVSRARAYLGRSAEERQQDRQADRWWARWTFPLLLWYVSQHPFWHTSPWHRNPASRRRRGETQQEWEQRQQDWRQRQEDWAQCQQQREDRLWAHVLDLRVRSAESDGWPRALLRLQAALCWRVMQPTLGMLWAEAAGHTSYRATWINVTDGGHYDNLGLVEALHRGAESIVVFDASGDRPDTWYTLGGAMALARTDAGVEISLNPTTMIRRYGRPASLGRGQVLQPWAYGTFTRQNGAAAPDRSGHRPDAGGAGPDGNGAAAPGKIWICKLGWWDQAPWDVRAYAAGHSTYPCDPTLQQLYDGAEFEAYHALGAAAVSAAAEAGKLPLSQG